MKAQRTRKMGLRRLAQPRSKLPPAGRPSDPLAVRQAKDFARAIALTKLNREKQH